MTNYTTVLNDTRYSKYLDYGFVGLIDVMGDDKTISQSARVSYGR